MDIALLKIFKAVAEEQSITKAAKKLHYVQSNITTRVKQLEEELETQLFYRKPRVMTLTSTGKTLLDYTERILTLMDETQKMVQNTSKASGNLTIGAMETTAAVRLSKTLVDFMGDCPDVNLLLKTGPTRKLTKMVLDHELDGAFVGGAVQHPDLNHALYANESMVIVSSLNDAVEDLEQFNGKNVFALSNDCFYRAVLEEEMRRLGVIPQKLVEFGSADAILGCTKAGLGVCVLPEMVVKNRQDHGDFYCQPLVGTYSKIPTLFIWHKKAVLTEGLKQFIAKTSGL